MATESKTPVASELPLAGEQPRRRHWLVGRWWQGILGGVAALMVVYLGATTAWFGFVRYSRGVDELRWSDVGLPWRWSRYRVVRGEQLIATAQRLATERKLREALMCARAGLARAPASRHGRLLLAELEHAGGRRHEARITLVEGLPYHFADTLYVKPVLGLLLQQEKDSFVTLLARRHLARLPATSEAAQLFAVAAATASFHRGDYDQAEDFLRGTPKAGESLDGRLLGAKLEWERGYRDLALAQLRQLADERPNDGEVHRELVAHLRRAGRADEARRRCVSFQIAHPKLAWPRIELMHAYHDAGDAPSLAREIASFRREFADDRVALLTLADFAANAGDVALVDDLGRHAASRDWPREAFAFLGIEAEIVAGRYAAALERIRVGRKENVEWESQHAAVLESLLAVAAAGTGNAEAARSHLQNFLSQENLRADNLVAVANRFVALDAPEPATLVLAKAVVREATNQAVLTRLVELDIALNHGEELAEHVQQLLKMRRPSPDLLRIAQVKLGSDLFLFAPKVPAALKALDEARARSAARRVSGSN